MLFTGSVCFPRIYQPDLACTSPGQSAGPVWRSKQSWTPPTQVETSLMLYIILHPMHEMPQIVGQLLQTTHDAMRNIMQRPLQLRGLDVGILSHPMAAWSYIRMLLLGVFCIPFCVFYMKRLTSIFSSFSS